MCLYVANDTNMLSVRLYRCGILNLLPHTRIRRSSAKGEALGYVGFHSLYYKVPGVTMDVSMISIRNEADVNKMLDYA